MSNKKIARQCCDLLGWDWGPAIPFVRPCVVITALRDDQLRVAVFTHEDAEPVPYTIDLPTLAICALVRHAGPVDVGTCPVCEGKGCSSEYDDWTLPPPNGPGEDWHYVGLGVDLDAREPGLWERRRQEQHGRVAKHWYVRETPCPACVVDGKPTGRRVVSVTEAVLLAAPRRWVQEHVSDGRVRARAGLHREAEREGVEVDGIDVRGSRGRWTASGTFIAPGHEGAREALRQLAEEWRVHLPVLGDYIEARGILTAKQKSSLDQ